ncbi:MAG TPA: transporter [Myxococcota bacterium]|jgi:hypothetical protein|nr:transporter [Myxococcota bacterium]
MLRTSARSLVLHVLGLVLAAASLAAAAHAETPSDCPTWFPDFRCDRHGRPDGFIAPGTDPYVFEDPFITTGLSAWYLWHAFPDSSPLTGGAVNVAAVQARIAITDRLGFIATRDGWAWTNPDLSILDNDNGPMDVGLGFKYLLVSMPEHNFYLSPSLRFDIPAGDRSVFQGNGDGTIMPAIHAAWGVYERLHFLANAGVQIPFDNDSQVAMAFWNFQMDLQVAPWFVPFAGINGYTYLGDGDGNFKIKTDLGTLTLSQATAALGSRPVNGVDYGNLGSDSVYGQTTATLAAGLRIPIGKHFSVSAAYEAPVTNYPDVFKQRVTTNLLVEF